MEKIAILYDASQAVLSTFDLDEVLSQILAIMRDYFHLRHVAILLLDQETQTLRARSHAGWNKESEDSAIPLGSGLIGTARCRSTTVGVPWALNSSTKGPLPLVMTVAVWPCPRTAAARSRTWICAPPMGSARVTM